MVIKQVDVLTKDLSLEDGFQHFTSGKITELKEVYVKIIADDGTVGFGEVRGNCEYTIGASQRATVSVLVETLVPQILGRDPFDIADNMARVDRAIVGNPAPKAAIDIALHDWVARRLGVPVFRLLGGLAAVDFTSNQSIGFASSDRTVEMARGFLDRGYRKLKVRVGQTPLDKDLERLQAIRDEVGWQVPIAVDANQAWSVKEATKHIAQMERFKIEYVEQPVWADDIEGLREVTQNSPVPVMADESLHSLHSAFEIASTRAADLFHIKLVKSGGIVGARKIMAVAEGAGIGYMMGQMNEGALATAATVHCAAASRARYFELYGTEGITNDPASGLEFRGGDPVLKEEPGFGIQLAEDQLHLEHSMWA